MKKILFVLFALLPMLLVSCGDSEGSNTTRAGIIAEDMVRADVLSADDLEFDLVGVDEEATDVYHAVANIKTLNGLGMKVPRKVSVHLKYKGQGEWEDINNWDLISLSYLDEATGRTQTAVDNSQSNADGWDALNDAVSGERETIAGIDFELMFDNQYTSNLSSKRKLTKEEVIKVCKAKKGKDLYFYIDGKNKSLTDCYANSIGGHIEYDGNAVK